jgi:pyruvate kinase
LRLDDSVARGAGQGPKFRTSAVGAAGGAVLLVEYDVLEIGLMAGAGDTTRPGRITLADTVEQRLLIEALAPTQQVFLDDGKLQLRVRRRLDPHTLEAVVEAGGHLTSRKGTCGASIDHASTQPA